MGGRGMLIRSQDKESIVNFSNVISIDIIGFTKTKDGYFQEYDNADVWKITYSADGTMLYLGEYTTKEKAIKVLDMIEDRYNNLETAKVETKLKYWIPFIFQMPQDSEVEG